ncbi:uncharacterized protein N7479_004017 [Penicillium vulpinum]|uniref:uncharacterized protein n=1 Tax=Penicillium vulpinum TaxID=29845 RepID=UPI002546ED62|nr:uncharacterized protein N7479_004017 [Penicillium vulpinum]KAJ5964141.1 hypothetical protein N7479_004017 [Penicillium vulpinum]
MSSLLGECSTPRSSRDESIRRFDTIYIPSDDYITPTGFMGLYTSPKRQIKDGIPYISGDNEINSFKSQFARRLLQKPLAGSTRRAPLQQSLKVLQAGATTVDIPGTGGGKENIPPGIFVNINNKSKSENHLLVSKIARPAVQNAILRTRITARPKEERKGPLKRVALVETRGNVVRVPKNIEYSPPFNNDRASALKRTFSAIVIQRAWRSFIKQRDEHACAIATARAALAYEVITRWWRSVGACKLQEPTEQMKLQERPEQPPRRKSAGQRSVVRQSHHNSSRRGIRRL